MSTRSVTHIHQMKSLGSNESVVCSFYRHSDGYPTGHGDDLAKWLKGKGLKNGIGNDFDKSKHFNRAGTMAVKLCNHIQDLSGCELVPTGEENDYLDFVYHVYFDKEFSIKVLSYGKEKTVTAEEFDGDLLQEFFYGDDN